MEVPRPISVPPGLPVYHFQLAEVPSVPPTVLRVTGMPGQILFLSFAAPVAATDNWLTVIVFVKPLVVAEQGAVPFCICTQ
jgi:hypothetical protein